MAKGMIYKLAMPVMTVAFLAVVVPAAAQISAENPLEWAELTYWHEVTTGLVDDQTEAQKKTAALQLEIAAEYTLIRRWERKYNSYLKTVEGFASSLKAASTIYSEGAMILVDAGRLADAVGSNPQGIVATMSMNNLLAETAAELVSAYNLLDDAVATGGLENMLDGAERCETLWAVADKLAALHDKLRRLQRSISVYTLGDVWSTATAGMLDLDAGDVAASCRKRWIRAARAGSDN